MSGDAFGGVLVSARREVLLREPANHYGGYVWTFPKGKARVGETPEQAALREVHEETGYRAKVIAAIPGRFAGSTSAKTVMFLMAPLGDQERYDRETARTRWVGFTTAAQLIEETVTKAGLQRDLKILDAAVRLFSALPPGDRPAVRREDWTNRPMPERRATFPLDLEYGPEAMLRIRQGFLPSVMEEKWFAWYAVDRLHLHRSWTGFTVFEIRFVPARTGWRAVEAVANRDPEQYSSNDAADCHHIPELIDGLLVHGPTEPTEDGMIGAINLALQKNYLGDPDVVSEVTSRLFRTAIDNHSGCAKPGEPKATYGWMADVLSTDDAGYTSIPGWHCLEGLGVAMIRFFDLSKEECKGKNFRYVCNQSCLAINSSIHRILEEFDRDEHAAWDTHGVKQIGEVQNFVTSVLLGTNSLYFGERTLSEFSWKSIDDE